MALYKIYYSTLNHIKEYEAFEKKKREEGIKLSDKTVDEPTTIKVVDVDIVNKAKSYLKNELLNSRINEKEYKENLKEIKLQNVKERFNKFEIDAFTSVFKNEQNFIDNLVKSEINGEDILRSSQNGRQNKILVCYKNRGEIHRLEPVYNNKLLNKIALQFINRRNNGDSRKNIILTDNIKDDYYGYTSMVKKYLLSYNYQSQLVNKYRKTEKYNPLHKDFRIALESYLEYGRTLKRKRDMGDESENIELVNEVEHYSEEIDRLMLNYDIFRDVAVWEQKISENELTLEQLEQLNYEEEIRNDLVNRIIEAGMSGGKEQILNEFSLNEINLMPKQFLKEYKIDIDKLKRDKEKEEWHQLSLYENDIIYDYYNLGGVEAVINNFDIEDLKAYPAVVLEDVGVNIDGLGPKEDKHHKSNGRTR